MSEEASELSGSLFVVRRKHSQKLDGSKVRKNLASKGSFRKFTQGSPLDLSFAGSIAP